MKLPMFILGFVMLAVPAIADDAAVQTVAARKTCAEIAAEIATLSAIENPTDENTAELKKLQTMQRSNCVAKSAGRRTVMRAAPMPTQKPGDGATIKSDALSEYLANKKSNCEKLNNAIASANVDADTLASMRGVYDADCVEKPLPDAEPVAPEMSAEEWAKIVDANLAAGLCADGTKPNRFGCCTDEVFKDLGAEGFACCPKSGGVNGICFPPIK